MSEFKLKTDTHIVVKVDDVNKYLSDGEQRMLKGLLRTLEEGKQIYAEFLEDNGYKVDRERADELGLVVGKKYKFTGCSIGGWKILIKLEEFPESIFNSVMFRYSDAVDNDINIVERFRK